MSRFDEPSAMVTPPQQAELVTDDLRKLDCPGCGTTYPLKAGERIDCDCRVPPQSIPLWCLQIIGGPALARRLQTLAELAAEREAFESRMAGAHASTASAEAPRLQSRPWMRPNNQIANS
jgi:hypothetical protein